MITHARADHCCYQNQKPETLCSTHTVLSCICSACCCTTFALLFKALNYVVGCVKDARGWGIAHRTTPSSALFGIVLESTLLAKMMLTSRDDRILQMRKQTVRTSAVTGL